MPIKFICPNEKCKARYSVADEFAGKLATCKKCRKKIQVPFRLEPIPLLETASPAANLATAKPNRYYEFKGSELPKNVQTFPIKTHNEWDRKLEEYKKLGRQQNARRRQQQTQEEETVIEGGQRWTKKALAERKKAKWICFWGLVAFLLPFFMPGTFLIDSFWEAFWTGIGFLLAWMWMVGITDRKHWILPVRISK